MIEKLGNIATYLNGYAFKPSDWSESGLPIIRIQDLTGTSAKPNYYEKPYDKKYEINEGDVLISWSASLGVYVWHGRKALLNQHIFKVIFDKIAVDKDFFVYQVEYILEKATALVHGATMQHLTRPVFNNLPFKLFPIERQQKIALTLNTISTLINDRQKQLQYLDGLIKSQFIETFGRPGEDVKGWGLTTLGKCCKLNPRNSTGIADDVQVSFVPMSAVSEHGTIDVSGHKPYGEVKTGYTHFEENDVLFAKITPCMENGKGAVATGLENGIGAGSTEFHVLRPIPGKSNPYWLYTLTMLDGFREEAKKRMTGTGGQLRVPIGFLNYYPISAPPIDLQNTFESIVKQSDKSRLAVQKSLDELEILKKSLMQKYFG